MRKGSRGAMVMVVVAEEEEACWWERGWDFAKGQKHCRERARTAIARKKERKNKSAMVGGSGA